MAFILTEVSRLLYLLLLLLLLLHCLLQLPSRRAVILALERHDPDKENCRGSAPNIKQSCDT
ncbi:hypothetical protein EGR_00186 [Echinococcus granulosus]|uniref:Uncharacterized protein n=1 Tax=Echinococcus granulosus TaxID=6210 RepID=W6V1T4_ECHGR|nr:hypothetical protein EGR_00186 [Echinococcus granulosus]EUB64917.1 hypothetical protein EGR_00186 [Echinococcus granulosus]